MDDVDFAYRSYRDQLYDAPARGASPLLSLKRERFSFAVTLFAVENGGGMVCAF